MAESEFEIQQKNTQKVSGIEVMLNLFQQLSQVRN